MYKTQFIQRLNSFSPHSVCVVSSSMDESVPLICRPYGYITRRTRARYHYAVRCVIKEETRIKSNRMAEAISEGNDRNLWKEVHSF